MKPKALLVDDHCDARDSAGSALRSEGGYDVTLACNGQEALNALRDTGFDLVLLDLDMPVRNGWDALGQIVTVSLSLPVIIITAEESDQQWLAAQKGVAAVLGRPFNKNLLLEAMAQVLAATATARQRRIEAQQDDSAQPSGAGPKPL